MSPCLRKVRFEIVSLSLLTSASSGMTRLDKGHFLTRIWLIQTSQWHLSLSIWTDPIRNWNRKCKTLLKRVITPMREKRVRFRPRPWKLLLLVLWGSPEFYEIDRWHKPQVLLEKLAWVGFQWFEFHQQIRYWILFGRIFLAREAVLLVSCINKATVLYITEKQNRMDFGSSLLGLLRPKSGPERCVKLS